MILLEMIMILGTLILLIIGFVVYWFFKRKAQQQKQIDPDLINLFDNWPNKKK